MIHQFATNQTIHLPKMMQLLCEPVQSFEVGLLAMSDSGSGQSAAGIAGIEHQQIEAFQLFEGVTLHQSFTDRYISSTTVAETSRGILALRTFFTTTSAGDHQWFGTGSPTQENLLALIKQTGSPELVRSQIFRAVQKLFLSFLATNTAATRRKT